MNADSVKARLKNFAVSSGCTFQEALVYYGLERTIYRISVSPYADQFAFVTYEVGFAPTDFIYSASSVCIVPIQL